MDTVEWWGKRGADVDEEGGFRHGIVPPNGYIPNYIPLNFD